MTKHGNETHNWRVPRVQHGPNGLKPTMTTWKVTQRTTRQYYFWSHLKQALHAD